MCYSVLQNDPVITAHLIESKIPSSITQLNACINQSMHEIDNDSHINNNHLTNLATLIETLSKIVYEELYPIAFTNTKLRALKP